MALLLRRYIFIVLLFTLAINAFAQRITTEREIYDFGSILYDVPALAKFELTNKGNDLKIEDIHLGCGCMRVDYPKEIIPKGDKFSIEVSYDARQLGHFEKDIAIYSNASELPFYLKIKGVVVAEPTEFSGVYDFHIGKVSLSNNTIEFDDVVSGEERKQKLYLKNDDGNEIHPVFLRLPSYLTVEMVPRNIAPGHTAEAIFTLDVEKLHKKGLTQDRIYLAVNKTGKLSQDNQIIVSSLLLPKQKNMSESQKAKAPNIELSSDTLDLGSFKDKQRSGVITIENHGRSTLTISSLQAYTQGVKASLSKKKIPSGESAKLKITVDKKLIETLKVNPRVLMITNDPDRVKVVVNIKIT